MRFNALTNSYFMLLFIAIFVFLFCLNFFLPPQADDLYAAQEAKNGIQSSIKSYMTWNARIGEMLFVGFIGGINDSLFNVLNAFIGTIFIFVFFIFIFARLPKCDKNINDFVAIIFILFLLLYFAPFGADFLWGSGSLNYMWGILLIMLILLPYRLFYQNIFANQKIIFNIKNKFAVFSLYLAFFIFSFLGGMASEQIGIVSIIVHIVLLIYTLKAKIKLPLWYILGIICFIMGFCALYFSPGNAARASMTILQGQFLTIGEILKLPFSDKINRVFILINNSNTLIFDTFLVLLVAIFYKLTIPNKFKIAYFIFWGWVIFILLFLNNNILISHIITIILLIFLKKYKTFNIILYLYLIYLLICLSGIQILILPSRARLGDIMIIIAIFCILYNRLESKKIINIMIVSSMLLQGGFVFSEYYKFYSNWNDMIIYINHQKAKGNYDVIVKNIFKSKYSNFIDSPLPTDIAIENPNPLYANKFGLNSFRIDNVY